MHATPGAVLLWLPRAPQPGVPTVPWLPRDGAVPHTRVGLGGGRGCPRGPRVTRRGWNAHPSRIWNPEHRFCSLGAGDAFSLWGQGQVYVACQNQTGLGGGPDESHPCLEVLVKV